MDGIEVINFLKQHSDKKTEREIKSPPFLFSVAISSYFTVHSWSGLNYRYETKYETLGNG